MFYYSTRNRGYKVPLETAVREGMPPDNGLYMPEIIPRLPHSFLRALPDLTLREIALHVARAFFNEDLPGDVIDEIVNDSITFDTPLTPLDDSLYALELFHGPTLAFKDVGARFMARLMTRLRRDDERTVYILVATSGDTGSAVAHGFYNVPGVHVVLLYPKGRVSALQEQQMATLGGNITALEVDGVFDDCQRLVKSAFLDKTLTGRMALSSANSINIARLLPQTFYYFYGVGRCIKIHGTAPVVCVPSGNFGNLTAGLIAERMGLPVHRFIAAVNANAVFPDYIKSGNFTPRPSVATLSNAMDVGNPSNLGRITDLFDGDLETIRKRVYSASFTDNDTRQAMRDIYERYNYIADPHGAVGWLGVEHWRRKNDAHIPAVFLETAHPAKFAHTVREACGVNVDIPERLARFRNRPKITLPLSRAYPDFRKFLLDMI